MSKALLYMYLCEEGGGVFYYCVMRGMVMQYQSVKRGGGGLIFFLFCNLWSKYLLLYKSSTPFKYILLLPFKCILGVDELSSTQRTTDSPVPEGCYVSYRVQLQ